jgi:peptidoglycan/LPS O-acetylase OafA/YrhL
MVLATALIAPAFVNSSITTPISLWRSFLLIPDRTFPLLAVGWTLVYEMYFYLAFAIFLVLRISVVVGLMAWGVLILVIAAAVPDQIANSPALRVIVSPLTAEFMMGAFVGMLWWRRWASRALTVGAFGLAGLIVSIVYVAPMLSLAANPYLDDWRVIIFGIPAALIVYALTGLEQRYPSGRQARLLVALGDWSYATYLVHVLVISAIGRIIFALASGGGGRASFALVAAGLLVANVAGAGIHVLFERPTLNWLRRFGARLKTEQIDASASETNGHIRTPQRS